MSNLKSQISNRKSACRDQRLTPRASRLAPRPSRLTPRASRLNPRTYSLQPTAYSLPRSGFTLVELMVTVSIIAILASILLGALYVAQDQARAMKTKSTIAKLNTIMMARWESYKTRRVPISIPAGTDPKVAAIMRLNVLREIMRLELPDRNSDIPALSITSTTVGGITVPRPSISLAYARRFGAPTTKQYMDAECLYVIVTMSSTDDESGREMFGESEIGDKDADGRPEFHDAWGNPIGFIRWPAGFNSELQPLNSATNVGDPLNYHDPFDPRRVDLQAYALYPLIYSFGPDGQPDIRTAINTDWNDANGIPQPYTGYPAQSPPNQIGGPVDTDGDGPNHIDNIHNHLIGAR